MCSPFSVADDLQVYVRRYQAHDMCGVERRKVSHIDSESAELSLYKTIARISQNRVKLNE